ncbi:MAG: undecaprenyl-diphosphate phosphatase [Alphaproteobacteria bacterium]|nr:undecaprenyl-diphosphate phosphatase [Alphaproteobacteria bacterium]MBQ9236188.1 undecaprenyl-diphosphate phosphatase [Alphaproteobacteria bacterium]
MLSNLHILYLSILQGITEFLPVSSSGHLILLSKFTYFPDQGLTLDVAVHLGSILAVMLYFSSDIAAMLKGLWKTKFIPSLALDGARLFWLLFIGTLPVIIAGLSLKSYGTEWMRSTRLIGWTILGYGILLFIADSCSMTIRQIKHMGVVDALLIGCAQCLALIPGTSRSGITITMARFLGIERREAAKFSMLLSIPTILGAAILVGWKVVENGNLMEICQLFDGVVYSYVASIIAIYAVMWWLKKSTFLPFVIYRLALGSFLLLDSYGYLHKFLD